MSSDCLGIRLSASPDVSVWVIPHDTLKPYQVLIDNVLIAETGTAWLVLMFPSADSLDSDSLMRWREQGSWDARVASLKSNIYGSILSSWCPNAKTFQIAVFEYKPSVPKMTTTPPSISNGQSKRSSGSGESPQERPPNNINHKGLEAKASTRKECRQRPKGAGTSGGMPLSRSTTSFSLVDLEAQEYPAFPPPQTMNHDGATHQSAQSTTSPLSHPNDYGEGSFDQSSSGELCQRPLTRVGSSYVAADGEIMCSCLPPWWK